MLILIDLEQNYVINRQPLFGLLDCRKVNSEAVVIGLDQFKTFDRIDHRFGAVILLLYVSQCYSGNKKSNVETFHILFYSSRLSTFACVLFLSLLCKLKANLILCGITQPGVTT